MTTVGYGDEVPLTGVGRVVTVATALLGILIIAFFITSVSNALEVSSKARNAMQWLALQRAEKDRMVAAANMIYSRWKLNKAQREGEVDETEARATMHTSLFDWKKRARAALVQRVAMADDTNTRLQRLEEKLDLILSQISVASVVVEPIAAEGGDLPSDNLDGESPVSVHVDI